MSKMERKTGGQIVHDQESQALAKGVALLLSLDEEARQRVLRHWQDRFGKANPVAGLPPVGDPSYRTTNGQ